MAYNLLGQQGPKGSRNPDPNLTDITSNISLRYTTWTG